MTTHNRSASADVRRSRPGVVLVLPLCLAALLIFSRGVGGKLDHDEHQFVASAAMLARHGLLPYRDYPYLHTPYLVFADAVLFRLAGPSARLLLTARMFSAACSFATVALLAAAVASIYRDRPRLSRWMTPVAVLLLTTSPLFTAVTALAWNHDAAEMLLLAAALLMLRDIRGGSYTPRSMLACGALLGLSIGVRLTVAPAVAAFAGWILADRGVPLPRRLMTMFLLLLGMSAALLPCGWLYFQSPRGFLFGNFGYPTLNTAFRIAQGSMSSSTTPAGKIVYFLSRVVFSSGSGLLIALIGLTVWLGAMGKRTRLPVEDARAGKKEMTFLTLVILFLLAGSFAPAPMFIVYFYAPLPFAVLWLAYAWKPLLHLPPPVLRGRAGEGAGQTGESRKWRGDATEGPLPNPPPEYRGREQKGLQSKGLARNGYMYAAAILLLGCLACGIPASRQIAVVFRPSRWIPRQAHESGVALRRQLAPAGGEPGPVLTLAPIIPLEGGLDVYEQFATGPFAFRVAPMVPEADRRALHLIDEHDLAELLEQRPPGAVLFNVEEREEEAPLLRAVPKGCVMVRLAHGSKFVLDRKDSRHP